MDTLVTTVFGFALGIPAYYLTKVLLLEQKTSHEGPFKDLNRVVFFPEKRTAETDGMYIEQEHEQHVALFDWIRRPFGVYDVDGVVWTVRDHWKAELWSCPICLSFWTSLLFSVPTGYALRLPWYAVIVLHLGITAVSTYLNTAGESD